MFGRNKYKKKIVIEGMKCEHCATSVSNALKSIDGVLNVKVSLKNNYAIIVSTTEIDDETIKKAISSVNKQVIAIEKL